MIRPMDLCAGLPPSPLIRANACISDNSGRIMLGCPKTISDWRGRNTEKDPDTGPRPDR